MDFSKLFALKQSWAIFKGNHPRVPEALAQVRGKGFCEGQEIAIAIRYPDGTEVKTGIRLKESDLQLFDTIKDVIK